MSRLTIPVGPDDHILARNTPVNFVEYGDYQCPYCAKAYVIVKQIQPRSTSSCVCLPKFSTHPAHPGRTLPPIGRSRRRQGKFWRCTTLLRKSAGAEPREDKSFAQELGLD
jgi:hypothetical protein